MFVDSTDSYMFCVVIDRGLVLLSKLYIKGVLLHIDPGQAVKRRNAPV